MRPSCWLLTVVLLALGPGPVAAARCPAAASVEVLAENLDATGAVTLTVEGELLDRDATCSGEGATAYATTLTCDVGAPSACGRIDGLRPGAWAHRVRLQVPGSDEQVQSQRTVLLAAGPGVANTMSWTVYPRTFVVREVSGQAFLSRLEAAAGFTAATPGAYALVTFDRALFKGAPAPRVLLLPPSPSGASPILCQQPDDVCADGRKTAYCHEGSRVVVDALDDFGASGAVELSVGPCQRSLLRVTGSDNVLRGLVLRGSQHPTPTIRLDTIALAGSNAQRNRLEQAKIYGPTLGDAVSVEQGAGAPGGVGFENAIVDSEVAVAQDKGIKVTGEGYAVVAGSCVHDNLSGGVQATLGGHVRLLQNVVQRNRRGRAEESSARNGLLVGIPNEGGPRNTMETDGNVVRFSGARGISVVNAATGTFMHDVVAENQEAGMRIETTRTGEGAYPIAALRGVALACNHALVTGSCVMEGTPCTDDSQCKTRCDFPKNGPEGFGLVVSQCPGCSFPIADLGTGGRDAGRNALAWNPNPLRTGGVNFHNGTSPLAQFAAAGNQWEHCGSAPLCNVAEVQAEDLRPAGPGAAAIGTPTGPGGGPSPAIVRVVPARPRAGDFVRVYNGSLEGRGGTFNAVDGSDCFAAPEGAGGPPVDLPADPCSAESPAVVAINRTLSRGNLVSLAMGGETYDADVHAVTPTMLIFRMPVDCHAGASLTVGRRNDAPSASVPFCDPPGCDGQPAGAMCDDGDACTVDERCDGSGSCRSTTALACTGACLTGTCDPQIGCVPRAAGTACSDGDACTVGDRCDGSRAACAPGEPRVCEGECLTGVCDPNAGCVVRPASPPCNDGDACTVGDRCGTGGSCTGAALGCDDGNPCTLDGCDPASGCTSSALADGTVCPALDLCRGPALCLGGACDPGPPIECRDGDFCTDDRCDSAAGCSFLPVSGMRRSTCRVDEARALLAGVPDNARGVARRLGRRLDRAVAILEAIDLDDPPRRVNREFKRARRVLRGFAAAVSHAGARLGASLGRSLRRSAELAIANATLPPPER